MIIMGGGGFDKNETVSFKYSLVKLWCVSLYNDICYTPYIPVDEALLIVL